MLTRGRKGKRIVDDPQIRSIKPLFAIEVESSPLENLDIGLVGEGSPDHSAESPMYDLIDYLSPEMEGSILIEENLTNLKEKYDVPDEYEMLALDPKDRVFEHPKSCIVFYDETL